MQRLNSIFHLIFLLLFPVGLVSLQAQAAVQPEDLAPNPAAVVPLISTDNAAPDLFNGSLRYSIPILVPTGRKGMEPKPALTYRNSQKNGWLGIGWELDAGAIERSAKKGINYVGDDYILRMRGAAIELINDNGSYHAKIENNFFRIKKLSAGDGRAYWEVTDKSGLRYFFGQAIESRQDDPGDPTQNILPDPDKIYKWCLDRIEDPSGNYIEFSYFKHEGQIYLDQIDYTRHDTALPTNSVKFLRDNGTRPDAPVMYRLNFPVRTAYRLDTIEVTAAGNPVRSYKISYAITAITSQSLISSVQQVGKDGISTMPATQMDYAPESTGFSGAPSWGALHTFLGDMWYPADDDHRFADFNGDGRADAVYVHDPYNSTNGQLNVALSSGSGFSSPSLWGEVHTDYPHAMKLADYDGDGKIDVLAFRQTAAAWDGNMYVSLSTGSSFRSPASWGYYKPLTWPGLMRTGDFDGDGKADVAILDYYTSNLDVVLSTGSSFTEEETWSTMGDNDINRYRFADFDGDGKTDALFIGSDGSLNVGLSNGINGFTAEPPWAMMSGLEQTRYFIGDFNGDGKADVAYIGENGDLDVALSTGVAFTTPSIWSTMADGDRTRYKIADFDGNGKVDVLFVGSDGRLHVALSTGSAFVEAVPWITMGYGYPWRYHFADLVAMAGLMFYSRPAYIFIRTRQFYTSRVSQNRQAIYA